jgi:hypothetical protein
MIVITICLCWCMMTSSSGTEVVSGLERVLMSLKSATPGGNDGVGLAAPVRCNCSDIPRCATCVRHRGGLSTEEIKAKVVKPGRCYEWRECRRVEGWDPKLPDVRLNAQRYMVVPDGGENSWYYPVPGSSIDTCLPLLRRGDAWPCLDSLGREAYAKFGKKKNVVRKSSDADKEAVGLASLLQLQSGVNSVLRQRRSHFAGREDPVADAREKEWKTWFAEVTQDADKVDDKHLWALKLRPPLYGAKSSVPPRCFYDGDSSTFPLLDPATRKLEMTMVPEKQPQRCHNLAWKDRTGPDRNRERREIHAKLMLQVMKRQEKSQPPTLTEDDLVFVWTDQTADEALGFGLARVTQSKTCASWQDAVSVHWFTRRGADGKIPTGSGQGQGYNGKFFVGRDPKNKENDWVGEIFCDSIVTQGLDFDDGVGCGAAVVVGAGRKLSSTSRAKIVASNVGFKLIKTSGKLTMDWPNGIVLVDGGGSDGGGEEEEWVDDGEVCVVCGSSADPRGVTILLCETCDSQCHLACTEHKDVPKGAWQCWKCVASQVVACI